MDDQNPNSGSTNRVVKVRKAKYHDFEITVGENETSDEVKANLSEIFPEISHAEVTVDEQGNMTFTVMAGTKG